MVEIVKKSISSVIVFTVICGLLYTLVVTGAAQALFPHQANGSIIEIDGVKYGSEHIGQQFTDEKHLWGRIMLPDTSTFTDAAGNPVMYAWASNKTPAGEEMEALVAERVAMIQNANPAMEGVPIPVDLVTVSGSGLDPEISPAAAAYQVPRLAKANGMTEEAVQEVIDTYTTGRFLGIFGEERVNVLKVNLALEGILK